MQDGVAGQIDKGGIVPIEHVDQGLVPHAEYVAVDRDQIAGMKRTHGLFVKGRIENVRRHSRSP
jgi:hypothetical protein